MTRAIDRNKANLSTLYLQESLFAQINPQLITKFPHVSRRLDNKRLA